MSRMSGYDFFEDYVGKDVTRYVQKSGTWKATDKVKEEISQYSKVDWEWCNPCPSGLWNN